MFEYFQVPGSFDCITLIPIATYGKPEEVKHEKKKFNYCYVERFSLNVSFQL